MNKIEKYQTLRWTANMVNGKTNLKQSKQANLNEQTYLLANK